MATDTLATGGSTFVAREFLSDFATDSSAIAAHVETYAPDPQVMEITALLTLSNGLNSAVVFDFGQVTATEEREKFQDQFTVNLSTLNRMLQIIKEFRAAYRDAALDVLGQVVEQ